MVSFFATYLDNRYCHHLDIPGLKLAVDGGRKFLEQTKGQNTPEGQLFNTALQLLKGEPDNNDDLDKVCIMGFLYFYSYSPAK